MIRSERQLFLFRGRLWRATGLAALGMPLFHGAACGGEAIVESGEQSSSQAATSGSDSSGTSGTTATSGQGGASTSVTVSGQGGAQTASVGQGGALMAVEVCWGKIPNTVCPTLMEASSYYGVCTPDGDFIDSWVSGPVETAGNCCYEVTLTGEFCGVGRPLTTPEGAVTARAVVGDRAWGEAIGEAGELDVDMRAALAAAFTRDGLFEHASVASFARVTLELLALGAPPELVAEASRAALDEVCHAQLCFALASRFAGEPVGPGPLEAAEALELRTDLVAVAVNTFVEGCIGETLSAALALEQAARASDPEVRKALATIASDEARHAELAWKTVAWAVERGGRAVRDALGRALVDAASHAPYVPSPDDDALEGYGRLSASLVREVQRRALVDVVLPCARSLLAASVERVGTAARV
jgi:hypothetical protein